MANLCEKLIKQHIAADCENPIYTGLSQVAYIFNKSDVTSYTFDTQDANIITTINLKATAKGYKVQNLGKTPFTGTTNSFVEGNVQNKFNNVFAFSIPDNTPSTSQLVSDIANGQFVVVFKNDYKGSDGKGEFEVFGSFKGLSATAIERDKYSTDTDGAYAITLTEENAPKPSRFIIHKTEDEVDTESYLEGLCAEE